MPVELKEVLALLPEMFSGTQQIPLKNIRPNPHNPGPAITDDEIQDLADNISQSGLLNPIKVRADRANPLAGGVQLHPDNPRLRGDGQPWAVGDFNWEILAGENRYRAFGRLKREAVPGFILNPTVKEAVKITHLDNDVRDRGWWAAYQSIEQLIQADPNLTQRQVAVELKMDITKVNRAIKLLPLLNSGARALIVSNANNSNKGIWGISERAASQLTDLGPGSGLKPGVKAVGAETQKLWPYPAITPETQDKVKRTLEVAIGQELTEAGVKALVSWVQEGHDPEEYGSEGQEDEAPGIENEKFQQAEYKQVPVNRIRIHKIWTYSPRHPDEIERKALSMKLTGFVKEIRVRTLLEEERKVDPDHDFEVFEGVLTFEAAKKLGMPMLQANVHSDMDEWKAIRLMNMLDRVTRPNTWIEFYECIERALKINPKRTVSENAMRLARDPDLAEKVFPVMALLNEPAKKAIIQSIYKCHEGITDLGGFRFSEWHAIPLIRLEKVTKNLSETQEIVEKVVSVAIENEMSSEEIEELVNWVWDGNEPGDYSEKEA